MFRSLPISLAPLVPQRYIFGGKHVFDMCSEYFMYDSYNIRTYHDARSSECQIHVQLFFPEVFSTHKEFSEILRIQARIYVKQTGKLFFATTKPQFNSVGKF